MDPLLYLKAIVPPFLYATTNHFDNILLSKYFKEGGVGTLILFSALLSILALPILVWIDPTILEVSTKHVLFLALVGFINVLLLWCYLQAMNVDEPTVVIIYYQLVPVIALFLSWWWLGEVITYWQLFAMFVIIAGSSLLTVAMDDDGKVRFSNWKTGAYMFVASACWATESTLFKVVALEENPWRSLFWEHVALVVIGMALFTLVPHYRRQFLIALRVNSKPVSDLRKQERSAPVLKVLLIVVAMASLMFVFQPVLMLALGLLVLLVIMPIIGLNVLNEVLYMLGNSVAAFVVVLIPVSLTLLMNSFQPIFVLLIGGLFYALVRFRILTTLANALAWIAKRRLVGVESIGGMVMLKLSDVTTRMHLTLAEVQHVDGRNMGVKLLAIAITGAGAMMLGDWW